MTNRVPISSQIVQYSDSSEDEEVVDTTVPDVTVNLNKRPNEEEAKSLKNKKCRLELPSALLSMFKDDNDDNQPEDDGSRHQGRTRSFRHERGNWATYVYIPVSRDREMLSLIEELLGVLPGSAEWVVMKELHLSLSRTVVIFHHWIDELMASLGHAVSLRHGFDCSLGSVELFTNDEKTRTFLSLRVNTGHAELESLVGDVDKCFAEYQLPGYYKDPSFHVSVAWMLGDITKTVTEKQTDQLQEVFVKYLVLHSSLEILDTSRIEAKCGNKLFSFNLRDT